MEVLSAIALRNAFVSAEALQSLTYTLYLVAGIGAGRLESSGRVWRALWAGGLAGGFTGLLGSAAGQGMRAALEVKPTSPTPWPWVEFSIVAVITGLTAAWLGLLGGIAGWVVRRAVEPAA
jgi:hypothetical protein